MRVKGVWVLWVLLAILLALAIPLAWGADSLQLKQDLAVGDVTRLLTTFFVLALFVERTLEVFITAWRGEETVKRENEIQAEKQKAAPDDLITKANWLAEYKCETQAIALRTGLALGVLIAAVGVRSFEVFVAAPGAQDGMQAGTFKVLDVLVSGGIIGGGSDAIHKMMNVITEFFDATAKRAGARGGQPGNAEPGVMP
jgi:hypothetical protein